MQLLPTNSRLTPAFASVLSVLLLSSCSVFRDSERTDRSPLINSRQAILVVTDSWDSPAGELEYFERPLMGGEWKVIAQKTAIGVGRTGLAWGSGLHGEDLGRGPAKREGDGKAPAGVFRVSAVFGYASPDSAPKFRMPYVHITPGFACVDDINSLYYNLTVDSTQVNKVDWHSAEDMRHSGIAYKWGAMVDHNTMPRAVGGGSCIFLHIWDGPGMPTSGCTAFDETKLLAMLSWLDPTANPVVIQLPKAEYNRYRLQWQLPTME